MVALKAKGSQQKADDSRQKERGQRQMRTRSQNSHKWTHIQKLHQMTRCLGENLQKFRKFWVLMWKFCEFFR